MANFDYNNELQMTLILNGLRSDIKAIVLQHLPFANLEALAAKTKHVEAALKSYVQATLTATQQANTSDLDLGQAFRWLDCKGRSFSRSDKSRNNPSTGPVRIQSSAMAG